jgi:hypothetical protein
VIALEREVELHAEQLKEKEQLAAEAEEDCVYLEEKLELREHTIEELSSSKAQVRLLAPPPHLCPLLLFRIASCCMC